jgi:hypothetical protein
MDGTSNRTETGGTGGAAAAGQGAAGVAGAPGEAGGWAPDDGASGGATPSVGGTGGSPYTGAGGTDGAGISGESGSGVAGSPVLAGQGGSPSEPEATIGCRDPLQDGCAVCCETISGEDAGESCVRKSPSSGSDWYNSSESLDGPCPSDCEPCAQCSFRDEEQLSQMEPRPECACDTIDIGIDPCFAPMSCECFCQSYAALAEACPHLAQ